MSKKKIFEILPQTIPEAFISYLNSLNENECLISIPTTDSQTMTTQALYGMDTVNEIDQVIVDLYLKFVRTNNLTEPERKNLEITINHVRELIKTMIKSFTGRIYNLNKGLDSLKTEMDTMQTRVDNLEMEQMEMKRTNIIAEILIPLKRNIIREMTNCQIPEFYYDINILKSLCSLHNNDFRSSEFYIDIFRMNNDFRQEMLHLFQGLIDKWANDLNASYHVLLELMLEKERTNFQEHLLITDFLKDSLHTNYARLTTLLRQQNASNSFYLGEIKVMEKIYLKYFGHLAHTGTTI